MGEQRAGYKSNTDSGIPHFCRVRIRLSGDFKEHPEHRARARACEVAFVKADSLDEGLDHAEEHLR